MRFSHWFLVLIVLGMAGCASQTQTPTPAQPAWVLGESSDYPRSKYLTGVGDADTLNDAKSRARAELAKIFSISIDASSIDKSTFESSQSSQNPTNNSTTNSLAIEQEIRTHTKQLLQGVELAQVWKDETTQRYFALAVLPRIKTGLALRTEIGQLDQAIASQIKQTQATPSLFRKIGQSATAIQLMVKRETLNKQLQVVSALGQGMPASWSLEKLKTDHSALLYRVTITALSTGSDVSQIKTALENTLANSGYQVTPTGDYKITANLTTSPLPRRGDWYYHKAALTISIKGEQHKSLGGHEWNYKVSASDPQLARLRVVEKAKALMDSELNSKLLEIIAAAQ